MKNQFCFFVILLSIMGVFPLSGCSPASTATPPAFWQDVPDTDFNALHSLLPGETNAHLILGAIRPESPASSLSGQLSVFLGRWEGYDYAPPVKKDIKIVLVVKEINAQSGKAVLWGGTNLQYPFWVKAIHFRVVPGDTPAIEWDSDISDVAGARGINGTFVFTYDAQNKTLKGGIRLPAPTSISDWFAKTLYTVKFGGLQLSPPAGVTEPIELGHRDSFYVYKDYPAYLATKGITLKDYRDQDLQKYGRGYLLYLPQDYETQAQQPWPLIFFLCGSGDRGDNGYLLAKASPFMMIREKGPLPAIIVAPMLKSSADFASFPDSYLEGVLAEIKQNYRIDPQRISLTGLSMGAEAVYRFALNHPEQFSALAPLAGFNPKYNPMARLNGFEPFKYPMERIKQIPVWQIHGANDMAVPLSAAQSTIDDLIKAGGNVKFTVLPEHDHDVWTDTYSDPAFYEWLLQQKAP